MNLGDRVSIGGAAPVGATQEFPRYGEVTTLAERTGIAQGPVTAPLYTGEEFRELLDQGLVSPYERFAPSDPRYHADAFFGEEGTETREEAGRLTNSIYDSPFSRIAIGGLRGGGSTTNYNDITINGTANADDIAEAVERSVGQQVTENDLR